MLTFNELNLISENTAQVFSLFCSKKGFFLDVSNKGQKKAEYVIFTAAKADAVSIHPFLNSLRMFTGIT